MSSIEISDTLLNSYNKLGRNKDTWGFLFNVNGHKTKFSVRKNQEGYIVLLSQKDRLGVDWGKSVCLGLVFANLDLEDLFLAVTRGEYLS